jgi:hypothetical protein
MPYGWTPFSYWPQPRPKEIILGAWSRSDGFNICAPDCVADRFGTSWPTMPKPQSATEKAMNAQCQGILSSIINSSRARRLSGNLQSYLGIKDPAEITLFSERLRKFGLSGGLFSNFVNMRKHKITRVVDDTGSCWTVEEQRFRPITQLATRTTIHFSGCYPVKFADTHFEARILLNGQELIPTATCKVDLPGTKVVQIGLPCTLSASDECLLRFKVVPVCQASPPR